MAFSFPHRTACKAVLHPGILRMAFLLSCLFYREISFAQAMKDTLSEVDIKGEKKEQVSQDVRIRDFTSGQKITSFDSAVLRQYHLQNVSQLLAQQTPVFIRSYGFNGLATLNFRGSSAAQSQVYWNGIPISNAALGIADISLLPVAMTSRMNIVYGGSAALLGSGNVGGALMMETEAPYFDSSAKTRYEIAMGTGSFDQYQATAKLNFSTKKWFFSANMMGQTAANDFSYLDDRHTEKKNEHAELKGISAMTQAAYKPNEKHTLRLIGWYQKYDRNIPAALFESYSAKNRTDASLKIFSSWENRTPHAHRYLRASFIADEMRYTDYAIKLATANTTRQYYVEAGWKQTLSPRHTVLFFIPVHISEMKRLTSIAGQEKYAVAAAYRYTDLSQKLNIALHARSERIQDVSVFLPGINASYQLSEGIKLRANIQKTYRIPSLNELYFEPGGNDKLKPEQGWAQDAGYSITVQPASRFSIRHDLAVYHRLIQDWIVWYGGAIWTPHNIAKVRSAGLELECQLRYDPGKWEFHLGLKGNYTRAFTVESYVAGDGSVGKQIPYTPATTGLMNAGFSYASYSFNYNHTYTGYRYFNTDETGLLEAYHTANIQMSKAFVLRDYGLEASLLLHNIFNERYAVVAARPMPGRHLSLSFTLRKK